MVLRALCVLSVVLLSLPGVRAAESLGIPDPSNEFEPGLRTRLQQRKTQLEQAWSKNAADKTRFVGTYGERINAKDPRAPEAVKEKGRIEAQAGRIRAEASTLAGLLREDASLTARIEELTGNIQGLGFRKRPQEFERFALIAHLAQSELRTRLVSRLQQMVDAGAEVAMQKHFEKWLSGRTPEQVRKFADELERLGVGDPFFLGWLRDLAPKAARRDLGPKVSKGVGFLQLQLGKLSADRPEGPADAHLDSAIEVVAMFQGSPSVSELKVLKETASALYEAGEAVFTAYLLESQVNEIMDATDAQLRMLKEHTKHIQRWIRERAAVREKLQKLPPLKL